MAAPATEVPRTLGPFALEEPVGSGAMGVVYRAVDTRCGRRIALKVLPAGTAADDAARRDLLREARKAALLRECPFVVSVLEAGVVEGRAFLAMEFVDGVPVAQWLAARAEADRAADALRLIGQLAAGVQHAHRARVVHRDLKPANLLVDRAGNLKILDFGLAKDLSLPMGESLDRIVGTPLYMAPELLRMVLGLDPFDAAVASSPKLDVYGTAVTSVEMIVGHNPFAKTVNYGHLLSSKVAAPREFVPLLQRARLQRQWIALLTRCLASDPGQRPADFGLPSPRPAAPGPAFSGPAWALPAAVLCVLASLALSIAVAWWWSSGILVAVVLAGQARGRRTEPREAPVAADDLERSPSGLAPSRSPSRTATRSPATAPLRTTGGYEGEVPGAPGPSAEEPQLLAARPSSAPRPALAARIDEREEYRMHGASIAVVIGSLPDVAADAWLVAEDPQLSASGRLARAVRERSPGVPEEIRRQLPLPLGTVVAAACDEPGVRCVFRAVMIDLADGRRVPPPHSSVFGACVAEAIAQAAALQLRSMAMPIVAAGCGALDLDEVARAILAPLVAATRPEVQSPLRRFVLVAESDDDALLAAIRDAIVGELPPEATVARAREA